MKYIFNRYFTRNYLYKCFFFFFFKKITFTGKTAQKINKDKTRSNGPLFTQIRQGSVKEPFKVCENW